MSVITDVVVKPLCVCLLLNEGKIKEGTQCLSLLCWWSASLRWAITFWMSCAEPCHQLHYLWYLNKPNCNYTLIIPYKFQFGLVPALGNILLADYQGYRVVWIYCG